MIVTHLDKYYLPWGGLLLESAALNAPEETIYISAANLTHDEIGWLQKFNPNSFIRNHKIEVPETLEYRRYMQCRITMVLLEVYNEFQGRDNELIIAMNADMLIRKSMWELYAIMKMKNRKAYTVESRPYDVLLKFDDEHLRMKEIQNGVIVFNSNSPHIGHFLHYYNSMWDDGKIIYRDDQRQLYTAYNRFSHLLNFGCIPHDYVDGHFNQDSHIWSAHVHNRFLNYNKFRKELGLREENICPYPEAWGVMQ